MIILFSLSENSFAQDEIIKVDTDLITVPVTVLDRQGRYVTNLEKENFQIFENGVEQKVDYFETTEQPITVILLLDMSTSMKKYLLNVASGANTFLNQLRPTDQLIVASFCNYTKTLQKKASVIDIINNQQFKLKVCGKHTMLYEAVNHSLKEIKKISGRKAIVLFSDGVDSGIADTPIGQFIDEKDNFQDAEELDALIYTIQFDLYFNGFTSPNSSNNENFKHPDIYMQKLADISGGRRFSVKNIANLERTFAQIANELGQQYSIGYYPKTQGKKGERREIKVKVNVPNVAVRARESYIVGSNKD